MSLPKLAGTFVSTVKIQKLQKEIENIQKICLTNQKECVNMKSTKEKKTSSINN